MAVGIEHVEVAFAPRGILRRVWTKTIFAKVRPHTVNIGDVKDQSAPPNAGIAFFEVQNRSSLLRLQRCKR